MLPAMVGLIVLRVPITSLLFLRGSFTYADTLGTAYALFFFSLGLWAYSGVRIINAAFYSLQDTRTPVMGAFISVTVNATLSLLLMGPLKHGGLALATAICVGYQHVLPAFYVQEEDGKDRRDKDPSIPY